MLTNTIASFNSDSLDNDTLFNARIEFVNALGAALISRFNGKYSVNYGDEFTFSPDQSNLMVANPLLVFAEWSGLGQCWLLPGDNNGLTLWIDGQAFNIRA